MNKKLSRRDFARTSVAAGAAVALPTALLERGAVAAAHAAAAGAAAAKRRRAVLPDPSAYGGFGADGRQTLLADVLTPAGQAAPTYPGGWKEGTTIPAEYYIDEKLYLHDERFLREHFWSLVDHESRIPKPGDYFLYQFGRGDSVIIVRDQAGAVKGYHNVCRHRGSRVCLHDEILPSESGPGGKRPDPKFSVMQLGSEGNTPVFRCPYHAWTYDLNGRLVSVPPNGTPSGFDQAQHGLHPAHVRTMEGFIYVSLALQEPPSFENVTGNGVQEACQQCSTAQLKVAARRSLPTKANWKLVIENFRECYHCQPSHTNSYIRAHWLGDETLSPGQVAQIEQETLRHGHEAGDFKETLLQRGVARDQLTPRSGMAASSGNTAARRPNPGHFRPGYATASLDGKPVGPLLPGIKEYSHAQFVSYGRRVVFTSMGSGMFIYDDYVCTFRFTPRDVMSTDCELIWLVHPEAKEGKDYNVEHLIGLWNNTLREDRWVAENNHTGLLNSRYALNGGQPYMLTEGGPAGFIKWYMREVASTAPRG